MARDQACKGLDPMELEVRHRRWILAAVLSGSFLASLNTTMTATLVTSIGNDFNESQRSSWIGTAFLLSLATFTPLYGRLCNLIGRRGANRTALFFLLAGTVFCGFAPSLNWLILARFISGAGGGGLLTTSSIVISDCYSLRERSVTQAYASVVGGCGMGLGSILGAYIAELFGWRFAFLIQIPLFFLAFIMTSSISYSVPTPIRTTREIIARIDYLGTIAIFITVSSVLTALSQLFNNDLAWYATGVYPWIITSVLGIISFILVEFYISVEPILAPSLLKQKLPILVGLNSLFVGLCNFSIIYFFPLYFETVAGASSSEAGAHLAPNSLAMIIGSIFAGQVMKKTGRYKQLNLYAGLFPFLAACFLVNLKPTSSLLVQWLSIIPLGFGNAIVLQTTLIALLVAVDRSQLAVATGFVQFWRGLGQVLAVAISSAIFQSLLAKNLARIISDPELIKSIRSDSRVVLTLPIEQQKLARLAYGDSIRVVFAFAAAMTFFAFLVRLGIPERSLDDQAKDQVEDSEDSEEEEISRPISTNTEATPLLLNPSTISISAESPRRPRMMPRRVSTFQDEVIDPELSTIPSLRRRESTYSVVGSLGRASLLSREDTRDERGNVV